MHGSHCNVLTAPLTTSAAMSEGCGKLHADLAIVPALLLLTEVTVKLCCGAILTIKGTNP